ncbi:energy transducer TonB [Pontibacter oryzae]|uniref:TonB family protein n=1 Tax=Pontibacter oryzae TaxID=2304593 RepID=A0A399S774_9BACT|nr:energy transducer TonB [Pontibacter oryzae]RIJ37657.1 TonB family protein [Pontibacter oryzae]
MNIIDLTHSKRMLLLLTGVVFCALLPAHAQTKQVRYLSETQKEVPASEAYFIDVKEINEAGGGTRTRFLAKDSTKVHQLTYSNFEGGKENLGHLNGPYSEWHESGHFKIKASYENNKLNGEYSAWYDSGQLQYTCKYKNNMVQDTLVGYFESGKVRRIEIYEQGKVVSGKVYNEAGAELSYFPMREMPVFPGGEQAMLRWLATNIKYPKSTRKAKVQGLVLVSYVVNEQGKLENIELIKGIHPDADAEALRVIHTMLVWIAGKYEGEAVPVHYTLPIRFSL